MTQVWQRLFADEPHHIDQFRALVSSQAPESGTILDLGCGDNTALMHLRSPRCQVWGTDFQSHPRLVDKKWFRQMPNDGSIPFSDESFDMVTAQWVLEHVTMPASFLAEVGRVLRPNGVFIAHSINARHYVVWLRRCLGFLPHRAIALLVKRLYGRATYDTFPTAYRLNTRRQIQRAASGNGLSMVDFRLYADPGYFSFSRWATNVAAVADWALERTIPGHGRIYFTVVLVRGGRGE